MSLTFQLARGGLALGLFAALTLTAWLAPRADAEAALADASLADVVAEAAPAACPVVAPLIKLAAAPADLPTLRRAPGSCRA
jgi:hypothetical protein